MADYALPVEYTSHDSNNDINGPQCIASGHDID